jgi:hypothetical protein
MLLDLVSRLRNISVGEPLAQTDEYRSHESLSDAIGRYHTKGGVHGEA